MTGEVLGESVKSAMVVVIRDAFKVVTGIAPSQVTTYPTVYKERIVEGLIRPSFFIGTLNIGQTKHLLKTYSRDYQMKVEYHILESQYDAQEQLMAIATKLIQALATINVTMLIGYTNLGVPIGELKTLYGRQFSMQVVDEVLQVFVTYTARMKEILPEVADMETLVII